MHQLIHVYYKNLPAGIFDVDTAEGIGRFEWLETFSNQFNQLTGAYEVDHNSRYIAFDASCELPLLFKDYLPGNFSKALLREALRNSSRTVESLSSLSWLSIFGDRSLGAFRFEPVGYPELNAVESVDLDRMVRFASLVLQGKGSELSDRRLRDLLRCGLFVRGNSPKILVAVNDFTGEVLSGQGLYPNGYDGWILKLDGVRTGSAEKLAEEFAYYKKAQACGIQVAPCRMLRDGHWKHLLVKRFDRSFNTKQAFLNYYDSEPSWEAIFRRMRIWRLPYPDMEEMYKRLLFSILTNDKAYGSLKICFLFSDSEGWRLAPAFNLKPSNDQESFRLSLFGKTSNWSEEELQRFGKQINIRKAKTILTKIKDNL
ncbi:MAG TPA: HipA domain-containing protein [Bacteroidales bacterium]|nr:HipA domain-containing protein [Bacteroidales bacterium]